MPGKIVVNCSTRAVTRQPLTAAEEQKRTELVGLSEQHAAASRAALEQRQADLATLRAYAAEAGAPPAWAALARLLGAR